MEAGDYDPRYLEGIRWFNQQEFFEAHEVWEDVWRDNPGAEHKFYQGLIQVAVCLHHFRRGNTRGARKLYNSSRAYLDRYRPTYLGLDIERLFRQLERCCGEIASSKETFPSGRFDPALAPQIELHAASAAADSSHRQQPQGANPEPADSEESGNGRRGTD